MTTDTVTLGVFTSLFYLKMSSFEFSLSFCFRLHRLKLVWCPSALAARLVNGVMTVRSRQVARCYGTLWTVIQLNVGCVRSRVVCFVFPTLFVFLLLSSATHTSFLGLDVYSLDSLLVRYRLTRNRKSVSNMDRRRVRRDRRRPFLLEYVCLSTCWVSFEP
jgi:hypothetical protein